MKIGVTSKQCQNKCIGNLCYLPEKMQNYLPNSRTILEGNMDIFDQNDKKYGCGEINPHFNPNIKKDRHCWL